MCEGFWKRAAVPQYILRSTSRNFKAGVHVNLKRFQYFFFSLNFTNPLRKTTSSPFSDLASKIHTRFQTWPLKSIPVSDLIYMFAKA